MRDNFKSKDKRGQYKVKRDWYLKHKQQVKDATKKFAKNNPEKVKAYYKKYATNNPEKVKETKTRYELNNPEKVKQSKRLYQLNHRKQIRNKLKEWRANHPEKVKISRDKYPHKIKARGITQRVPMEKSCEICGSIKNLQRHHWRYDKPRLVNTLCSYCHSIQHLKNKK